MWWRFELWIQLHLWFQIQKRWLSLWGFKTQLLKYFFIHSILNIFQNNCRRGCPCENFECRDVPTTTSTTTKTTSTTKVSTSLSTNTTMEDSTTNSGWISNWWLDSFLKTLNFPFYETFWNTVKMGYKFGIMSVKNDS